MAAPLTPYHDLLMKVQNGAAGNQKVAKDAEVSIALSEAWLARYQSDYTANHAIRLIEAAHSASVEVVSAVSLGLARPAVFSLRSHFELFMMFLFYRDHPIEFAAAANDVEYMKLPGEITKYLKKYFLDFDKRLAILDKTKLRPPDSGYSRLSEIVHGSSKTAAPKANIPADVCFNTIDLQPLVRLVADVAEELSDIAIACHLGNYMSLPSDIQKSLDARGASSSLKAI